MFSTEPLESDQEFESLVGTVPGSTPKRKASTKVANTKKAKQPAKFTRQWTTEMETILIEKIQGQQILWNIGK